MKNGEICMATSKLINGDCLEELKKLDEDSVDLLCTDPPYGYGFMGKHWDTFQEKKSTKSQKVGWMSPGMTKSTYGMKEFFVPIWEESLRVLKPGAFSFVMSAPRSDVQTVMVQTLQEVGFDVSFTPIYWAYATGFPKALNIGKAVDKRLNKKRKVVGKREHPTLKDKSKIREPKSATHNTDTTWDREWDITEPKSDEAKKLDGSYAGYQPKPAVEVVIVAMKPLGKKKGYVDQALDNGKGVTWLDSCRIPFAGMNDEEQFDKDNVAGHQKFIEKRKDEMYGGGWDKPARKSKSDYEKYVSDKNNKENYSDERGWDKWGVEEESDTYERVSAFGDTEQSETKDGRNLWGKKATKKVKITKRQPRTDHNVFKQSGFKSEKNDTAEASPLGRFAANLLISDNILDTGKKTKSSGGRSYQNTNDMYSGGWAHDDEGTGENPGKGDVGDFSRFYSLDEWWKFRMSRLPEEIQRTFPFLVVPKASKSEKNMGLDKLPKKKKLHSSGDNHVMNEICPTHKITLCPCGWRSPEVSNFHPTVKPIDLMSYLVVLGSRKNDVILDPFAGSGTTGIACVFSERNYILIEREKEYFNIMEARIKKAKNPADLVQHEWF
jgi:DNA modification methylase